MLRFKDYINASSRKDPYKHIHPETHKIEKRGDSIYHHGISKYTGGNITIVYTKGKKK